MRSIIITGAGSGMGRATADRYLAEGWHVLALDIAPVPATDLIHPITVDVRDRSKVSAAIEDYVTRTRTAIDVVANVAGIYPPSDLESYTEELYRRTFDINVLGVLNVASAALPHLREGGAIVNFASVDGLTPSPGQLLYSASKAAVVMLTRSMAGELAPRRIRVNAIAPGWIDSVANRATGRMEAAAAAIPLGRIGQPEEVAELAWFLGGSGLANYLTGVTLNISGGACI